MTGIGLSKKAAKVVGPAIEDYMNNFKKNFETKGEVNSWLKYPFPMDTLIPSAALYYGVQFASNIEENENYLTFGFDLHHFGMINDAQNKALRKINTDFWPVNKGGLDVSMQFTIDDNFFGQVFTMLTALDQSFSVRKVSEKYTEYI